MSFDMFYEELLYYIEKYMNISKVIVIKKIDNGYDIFKKLANEKFELYKILERTRNKSREKYPNVQLARDYDELIRDDRIELIVVNTPDSTHYEYTSRALEAGKHVVVEKPFTLKYRQAMDLIELADKKLYRLCNAHLTNISLKAYLL